MKIKFFYACTFLLLVLLSSCQLFPPEEPQEEEIIVPVPTDLMVDNLGIPDWYPSIYNKLSAEDDIFDSVYQSFSLEYGIDSTTRIDMNYYSLCSHVYQYNFWYGVDLYDSVNTLRDQKNTKAYAWNFARKWWRLFSSDGFEINNIDSSTWHYGAYTRYNIYIKNQYDYPIWRQSSNLGEMSIRIDSTFKLLELSSTLPPMLPIPENPIITQDSSIQATIDKPWTYYGFSGHKIDCIVDSSDIASSDLRVYINKQNSYIIYRLIWCVTINGPVDFIYDAITGEFIGYYLNFVT